MCELFFRYFAIFVLVHLLQDDMNFLISNMSLATLCMKDVIDNLS
jgi:hypothetical protein